MHVGLMMGCDLPRRQDAGRAFQEAFSTAAHAEEWGFDGV